jgi:TonB family protein
MIKNISLFILLALSIKTSAQSDSTQERPLAIVDKMPSFPGGEAKMMSFIQRNVHYPITDREMGIQGTSYITFVVEKDGLLTDIKVLRGVPCGAGLDFEAMRVIKAMPSWEPGTQNGRAVRVQFNLPMRFSLEGVPNYDCNNAQQIGKQVTEHYNAGVKYSENKQYEKAIFEFTEVIKLYPTDIDALYNRGVMYAKMEKNKEACKDWNKIKSLGRSDADELINKYCK